MPNMETADLRQIAVLWSYDGTSVDDNSQPKVNWPVEVLVRWLDDRGAIEDAFGENVSLDAIAVVNQLVRPHSILYLGTLEEWTETGITTVNNGLHEVQKIKGTPDVKARSNRRVLGLVKHRDTLPEVLPEE